MNVSGILDRPVRFRQGYAGPQGCSAAVALAKAASQAMTVECVARARRLLRQRPQRLHQFAVHELIPAHDVPGHQRVA